MNTDFEIVSGTRIFYENGTMHTKNTINTIRVVDGVRTVSTVDADISDEIAKELVNNRYGRFVVDTDTTDTTDDDMTELEALVKCYS